MHDKKWTCCSDFVQALLGVRNYYELLATVGVVLDIFILSGYSYDHSKYFNSSPYKIKKVPY